ncbi:WAT1-related protein At5g47470-like isoform X2 [Phoenix dactylifera]|uniref:WAT1-related protein n=1 Tax=Phoenix dactylifera TaxID=42345 RepID=A0A8B7CDE6_PHODC|nr:WAT1-related protein At5g47470-like isoform X2 [Phoenix dactylifera]
MLGSSSRGGFLKEFLIISGLFGVQVVFGVYTVILNRILGDGLNPLLLIVFGNLTTSIIFLPFAVIFEKKKWPAKLSPTSMVQFVLLALGGVTMYQAILLLGIKKTSPAIASAMPNLAPGFIFIIAACFRFEKFDIRCKYSGIKILGTLVCLSGAIVMSFLQSPSTSPMLTSNKLSLLGEHMNMAINKEWMLGCFYLLAAVIILSCNTVLQAATMLSFPAPLSLCVITSMMGSILTAMLQFIVEGRIDTGSPTISVASIIALVLGGGVVIGGCVSFQTWCVNRKGPVLVAIFSPIQTVCSAILSAVLFRQTISLGSLAGIVLMFSGLYLVLWAKNNEGFSLVDAGEDSTQPTDDIEKPLLS